MKSTRMVCSLVVLSSPLCIDAAASSTAPDALHWEVVQVSSLISRTKADHTKQPTALALEEAEHATKFIKPLAKLNKDIYLQELKAVKSRAHHYRAPRPTPTTPTPAAIDFAAIAAERTSYQDSLAEQRKIMHAQLRGTGYALKPTVMLYSSNGKLVEFDTTQLHTEVDKGTVLSNQNYIWTPKEIASGAKTATVWRPKLALIPEENTPVVTTVTAMNNILAASVVESTYCDLSTKAMITKSAVLEVLPTDPSNRTAKENALFDAQCAMLSEKAAQLSAQIGLSPKLGYYVRAVLDEFIKYSEENDERVQTSNDIFKSAFGTTSMVKNNRPAVVALYAEVAGAVQDPYATGAWSYLGTNEPKEVTELNACNAALRNETDATKIASVSARRDQLIEAIHAKAVEGLNDLVKQEKITTDKLRAETKQADSLMAELRNTLRQLSELQTLQSVLNERNTRAEQHPASSSSSR